jgi:hypothetical protein
MYEQPQRLARSADRSGLTLRFSLTLQSLALAGPRLVRRNLSGIFRFEPDSDVVRQHVPGTGHMRNDLWLDGRQETYLYRITCENLAMPPLGPHRCEELTPKTTESHWSGGQREP